MAPQSLSNIEVRVVYILVMGLTGAGKSTFISVATGDDEIPIGKDDEMDGVTQAVQDYILHYRQDNVLYEIHLIDSPGFDDGSILDSEVLARIANYINTTYKLKHTIAGVIYLHDITKQKMGGVGLRNIRLLENMIGIDKWDNCTLVTTKWGCTTNPKGEEEREHKLRVEDKYFGVMLSHSRQARIERFDPKSKGKALAIIRPHLSRRFDPQIALQMVDPHGPMLALGDTDAGKVVADNLAKLAKTEGQLAEVQASQNILTQKFDEKIFEEFKEKRDKLVKQQQVNKASRWLVRTAIVSGGITAGVFTFGPGAAVLGLEVPFESFAVRQKRGERVKLDHLEKDYKDKSSVSTMLQRYGQAWLRNKNVKQLQDLDQYSLNSESSTEVSHVEFDAEVEV